MPIYDYKCPKCGVFELLQSITEKPLEQCPKCHHPVQRLISKNVGIMFKGAGFYVTDNRKDKGAGDNKPVTEDNTATSPPAGSESPAAAS